MKTALLLLFECTLVGSTLALAQPPATQLNCDPVSPNTACTLQEAPLPFTGLFVADTGGNGGFYVRTWDGPGVWVRWQIRTTAENIVAAWSWLQQVSVRIGDGQVSADGPDRDSHRTWAVNYEIFVPRQADLTLRTMNGAIGVAGVQGKLRFTTMNGAIDLAGVAGDVNGSTMNGAINIVLSGDHWEGDGLSVKTMNGAINLTLPAVYAAAFDLSNMIGAVNSDLPVTIRKTGLLGHHLTFGSGAPVHLSTMNGAINVRLAQQ